VGNVIPEVIPGRTPHRRTGLLALIAVTVVAIVLVAVWMLRHVSPGTDPGTAAPATAEPPAAQQTPPADPRFNAARAMLDRLPVKGWDREQDFARYRFGESWSDDVDVEFGHNGCNTRDDILRRDLADLVIRPGACYAQSGVLHDPYTGETIAFVRGPATSNSVEIDHLVSLADAWYKGARGWDDQRRRDFANDPRNLLAVSPTANFNKAYRDAASWLPPNRAFRCDFAARQIDVKAAYGLWVSAREKEAMTQVLRTC
jgi:hypothetical protein